MRSFGLALARGLARVYDSAGVAATYTDRNGAQSPCTVLVARNLEEYGQTAQVGVMTAVLSVRRSEVPDAPRKGERFTEQGGTVWTVASLQSSDELEHKVFAA